ncbi:unnamed protein product [Trichogramma brassicae]|uniref:AAA+ ATPase domain-containing protein n=1 Tax=Trichogramma brassicae TaxID=86971 RepID=A0A6H5IJK1_9HYME|nr:unnamed protein product [Trichogramma brassicae]
MADTLQRKYRDYKGKKRGPFRALVRRAYDEITENLAKTQNSQDPWTDDNEIEIESDNQADTVPSEYLQCYKRKEPDHQNGNSSDKELIDISSDDDQDKSTSTVVNKSSGVLSQGAQPTKKARLSPSVSNPSLNSRLNVPWPDITIHKTTNVPPVKSNQSNQLNPWHQSSQSSYASHASHTSHSNQVNEVNQLNQLNQQKLSNNSSQSHQTGKLKKKLKDKDTESTIQDVIISKKEKQAPATVPKVNFSDIGGNSKILETIVKLMIHVKQPETYAKLKITPPKGCILHGPPGCGKSLLVSAIAGQKLQLLMFLVPLQQKLNRQKLLVLLQQKLKKQKLLILLQQKLKTEIASTSVAETKKTEIASTSEVETKSTEGAITSVDENKSTEVASTSAAETIDIEAPSTSTAVIKSTEVAETQLTEIAETQYETANEIESNTMINEVEMRSPIEEPLLKIESPNKFEDILSWLRNDSLLTPEQLELLTIEEQDFELALKNVQPSAKREGFATVPDVTWDDIGSLQHIREELQMAILAPVKFSDDFENLGLEASTGVLLCGPPGCGKTLLAKAIANEAGINFISVKGPELLNMYVGESERAVRQCFLRARNSAPCVIFFDELDALCPKRSEGDSSASSRVVNQLLTEMDGVEGRKNVFILAASNRPDIIDPAVLRPGRLGKILYVGLPNPNDRVDILTAVTKNGTKPKLAADVDLKALAERCAGYTGADLAAFVHEAGVEKVREIMQGAFGPTEVCARHFEAAFAKIKPSVTEKDIKHYEKLRLRYAVNTTDTTDVQMKLEIPEAEIEAMET